MIRPISLVEQRKENLRNYDNVILKTKKGFSNNCLKILMVLLMAEKERFELSVQVSPYTRLAGEHLQPTRSLLRFKKLCGGGGRIRTHGASRLNGFQDRHFRPLSHSSKIEPGIYIILGKTGQYLTLTLQKKHGNGKEKSVSKRRQFSVFWVNGMF